MSEYTLGQQPTLELGSCPCSAPQGGHPLSGRRHLLGIQLKNTLKLTIKSQTRFFRAHYLENGQVVAKEARPFHRFATHELSKAEASLGEELS